MAATFPLARVVGFEISRKLSLEAQRIVDAVRLPCRRVYCLQADATTAVLPSWASILYFFNPFFGDVLKKTFERIHESLDRLPRRLRIISYCPPNRSYGRENIDDVLQQDSRWRLLGQVGYPENYYGPPFRVWANAPSRQATTTAPTD